MIWNAILFEVITKRYNIYNNNGFQCSSIESAKKYIETWIIEDNHDRCRWIFLAVDLQDRFDYFGVIPGASDKIFHIHLNHLVENESEKTNILEIYKARFR